MVNKSKYPPYADAKTMAIDAQCKSRADYIKWHTEKNIKYIPRYPERVYKDWISWNDYLGTNNEFRGDSSIVYREFWEAVKWAQNHAAVHNMNTMLEWLDWVRDHEEELPKDIPSRPDWKYDEWSTAGWKTWLGTDVRGRLMAAKMSTSLLCICSINNLRHPGNVYSIVQAEQGEAQLRSILARNSELIAIRTYKMPSEVKEEVFELVSKHGRREDDGYFIPLINTLLYELDLTLVVWRPTAP